MTPKQNAQALINDYSFTLNESCMPMSEVPIIAKQCAALHCRKQRLALNNLYYKLKPDLMIQAKFEEEIIFWELTENEVGKL